MGERFFALTSVVNSVEKIVSKKSPNLNTWTSSSFLIDFVTSAKPPRPWRLKTKKAEKINSQPSLFYGF
jgi:hypothetical protein